MNVRKHATIDWAPKARTYNNEFLGQQRIKEPHVHVHEAPGGSYGVPLKEFFTTHEATEHPDVYEGPDPIPEARAKKEAAAAAEAARERNEKLAAREAKRARNRPPPPAPASEV